MQTIVATLFAPGAFQTPPLAVTVSDAAGTLSQAMAAPAALTIVSVLTEKDGELRDIKPQAELALPAPLPVGPIAAAAGALALVALGLVFWRWRENSQASGYPHG